MHNTEITKWLDTDEDEIRVSAHTNVGTTKACWVTLILGGLTITLFTPSSTGVDNVLYRLGHRVITEDGGESLTLTTSQSDPICLRVEITSYNADPQQTDSTPTITASGKKVSEKYCALSRDIENEYGLEFGDLVDLGEWGIYEFQDRMNKRIKRGVDIFRWSKKEALSIGRREGVAIITPRKQLNT